MCDLSLRILQSEYRECDDTGLIDFESRHYPPSSIAMEA